MKKQFVHSALTIQFRIGSISLVPYQHFVCLIGFRHLPNVDSSLGRWQYIDFIYFFTCISENKMSPFFKKSTRHLGSIKEQ